MWRGVWPAWCVFLLRATCGGKVRASCARRKEGTRKADPTPPLSAHSTPPACYLVSCIYITTGADQLGQNVQISVPRGNMQGGVAIASLVSHGRRRAGTTVSAHRG
jgi:hypothetical protein